MDRPAQRRRPLAALLAFVPLFAPPRPAQAQSAATDPAPSWFALHGQTTLTEQFTPGFPARFTGPQSLPPAAEGRETVDATLFLGVTPWQGAEVWWNPEIDQGFGLHNTFGIAGFLSGEAYKVGAASPYFEQQRLFFRQTLNFGGATSPLPAGPNQFAQSLAADRLVITAGKLSVPDIFDTNQYAHDPRGDFLNWAVIDSLAFDYAANAWGYTYGAASELYLGRFALRLGLFNLSNQPNQVNIDPRPLGQYQAIGEAEENHTLFGQPGKLKLLYWLSRANLGTYDAALIRARATATLPATALVRSYRSKDGVELNLEQQIVPGVGAFLRAGANDGAVEADEFSDVDRSLSAGLSFAGASWGRANDTAGAAVAVNQISRIAKQYFAAGGLGILIGDGALREAGPEQIIEAYYSLALPRAAALSFDVQLVNHPAYDVARGPVTALGVRLHAGF